MGHNKRYANIIKSKGDNDDESIPFLYDNNWISNYGIYNNDYVSQCNREKAIALALNKASKGDVVLILGAGTIVNVATMPIIVNEIKSSAKVNPNFFISIFLLIIHIISKFHHISGATTCIFSTFNSKSIVST